MTDLVNEGKDRESGRGGVHLKPGGRKGREIKERRNAVPEGERGLDAFSNLERIMGEKGQGGGGWSRRTRSRIEGSKKKNQNA